MQLFFWGGGGRQSSRKNGHVGASVVLTSTCWSPANYTSLYVSLWASFAFQAFLSIPPAPALHLQAMVELHYPCRGVSAPAQGFLPLPRSFYPAPQSSAGRFYCPCLMGSAPVQSNATNAGEWPCFWKWWNLLRQSMKGRERALFGLFHGIFQLSRFCTKILIKERLDIGL